DPSIDTNPQNNASKADNEIYAQNYGDDFSDYIEFASENYGDGSLADSNNKNLGNTPAEIQRNQNLVNSNNQDYARIDKSKGEDSVVKIATTGIKITNKIRKIKGKLTKEKLKKIFKDEGIDIADDLTTLVDGKIGVDDALAILDLVVGTNLNSKKVKVIKSKNNHKYKPAPKKPEDIKGIPNLRKAKKKTSVQGGGKKRARYEDKKGNIYEWDYRHGTLEKYNKGGKHLGEYDPKTGKQLKPANKTRRVEP
ncbi:Colicin E3 (EC, partial [uncultured Gammaproteobacteria bacterium]